MRTFRMIVLTPAGKPEPSLAIAACRAGELGVLNLEYSRDLGAAREGIELLTRHGRGDFGIKVDGQASDFLFALCSWLAESMPARLRYVILTSGPIHNLRKAMRAFHDLELTIFYESICLRQAEVGKEIGADGIVAKGHEAGGRIGEETSFVLLQKILSHVGLPVWVHGGVGLHTAASCYAAGAEGVVLDSQLLLAKESPLTKEVKSRLAALDGSEMICLGERSGSLYRAYSRPNLAIIKQLQAREEQLFRQDSPSKPVVRYPLSVKDSTVNGQRITDNGIDGIDRLLAWRELICQCAGWRSLDKDLFLLGQDVSFAPYLARRFVTVGGILQGIRQSIISHLGIHGAGSELEEPVRVEEDPLPVIRYPLPVKNLTVNGQHSTDNGLLSPSQQMEAPHPSPLPEGEGDKGSGCAQEYVPEGEGGPLSPSAEQCTTRNLQSFPFHEGNSLARSHGTRYPIVQGPMARISDVPEFAVQVARKGALPFIELAMMRGNNAEVLLARCEKALEETGSGCAQEYAQRHKGTEGNEKNRYRGTRKDEKDFVPLPLCPLAPSSLPWGVGILGFIPQDLFKEQVEAILAHRPRFALIAGGKADQAKFLEQQGISTYIHCPSPGMLRIFLMEGLKKFIFEGMECGGHLGPRSSFVLWESCMEVLLDWLSKPGKPRASDDASSYQVLLAGGIHDALSSLMASTVIAPLAALGVQVGVQVGSAYLFTEEAVSTGAIVKEFQQHTLASKGTVRLETGHGYVTRCLSTPFTRLFIQERQKMLSEGRSIEEIRNALESLNLGRLRIAAKGIDRAPEKLGSGIRDQGSGLPVEEAPHPSPLPEGEGDKGSGCAQEYVPEGEGGPLHYVAVSEEEQRERGLYMIGQIVALRDRVCTIDELHQSISQGGAEELQKRLRVANCEFREDLRPCHSIGMASSQPPATRNSDIAIIGMACVLPKAQNVRTYWSNILDRVSAIEEIPLDRWDYQLYYHADRKVRDKIYSKWGGFVDEVPFDPMDYGMPPNTLRSIEPLHLLTLGVVRDAMKDAGYLNRSFNRERTSVILGAGGGVADLGIGYSIRSFLPLLEHKSGGNFSASKLISQMNGFFPEWTEDSFPGILMNVAAGRVANRFDLGGANFTVDAACASSMAALYLAVKELQTFSSDMVFVGGSDTMQNPFTYLCFSKTQALSPTGQSRPLDENADGIVLGEGVAVVVLKRLADAERDGDRIYAVIKGVGCSSDGRDKCLTAPRPEGQILALKRAYAQAGINPATIGLIEAHGTGTVAGDRAEVAALGKVFSDANARRQSCAIGSVKSMIGHTKCTAGVAGLIKVAMALYSKVLPPTLGVSQPNKKANFEQSPFYVNTEARPWLNTGGDGGRHGKYPRRAGVSAFGFGGTNFHAVLEEYVDYVDHEEQAFSKESAGCAVNKGSAGCEVRGAQGTQGTEQRDARRTTHYAQSFSNMYHLPHNTKEVLYQRWPGELFLWEAKSKNDLLNRLKATIKNLDKEQRTPLSELAFSQWEQIKKVISDQLEADPLEAPHPSPLPEGEGGPLPVIRSPLPVKESTVNGQRSTVNGLLNGFRLAIIATSIDDLRQKLDRSIEVLAGSEKRVISNQLPVTSKDSTQQTVSSPPPHPSPLPEGEGVEQQTVSETGEKLKTDNFELKTSFHDPRGIYLAGPDSRVAGKIAFLFPGQGSQYPGMAKDLSLHFSEVRACFERADQILKAKVNSDKSRIKEENSHAMLDHLKTSLDGGPSPQPSPRGRGRSLSDYIFPLPAFCEEDKTRRQKDLMRTSIAQPAIGAVSMAMCQLLRELEVYPDMAAGHSYGEYVALWAAGVLSEESLMRASEARGRIIEEESGGSNTVIRSPLSVKDSTVNGQRSTDNGLLTVNGQRSTDNGLLLKTDNFKLKTSSTDSGTMAAIRASVEQVLEIINELRVSSCELTSDPTGTPDSTDDPTGTPDSTDNPRPAHRNQEPPATRNPNKSQSASPPLTPALSQRERELNTRNPEMEVWIANYNAPQQIVISGTQLAVRQVIDRCTARGIEARVLEVSCAFHSPLVSAARERFAEFLNTLPMQPPKITVYSNTTANPHSTDPKRIADQLVKHLVHSVQFRQEIEAMYEAGARLFVEVGPRSVLTRLVNQILQDRPFLSVALDQPGRPGLLQLQHCLGHLFVQGASLNLDRLYAGRIADEADWANKGHRSSVRPLSSTTWMIRGDRIRPWQEAAAKKQGSGIREQGPGLPVTRSPLPVKDLPLPLGEGWGEGHPSAEAVNGQRSTDNGFPSPSSTPSASGNGSLASSIVTDGKNYPGPSTSIGERVPGSRFEVQGLKRNKGCEVQGVEPRPLDAEPNARRTTHDTQSARQGAEQNALQHTTHNIRSVCTAHDPSFSQGTWKPETINQTDKERDKKMGLKEEASAKDMARQYPQEQYPQEQYPQEQYSQEQYSQEQYSQDMMKKKGNEKQDNRQEPLTPALSQRGEGDNRVRHTDTTKKMMEVPPSPPRIKGGVEDYSMIKGSREDYSMTVPRAEDRVMLQFQEIMNQFLETQKEVMLRYMQTGYRIQEPEFRGQDSGVRASGQTPVQSQDASSNIQHPASTSIQPPVSSIQPPTSPLRQGNWETRGQEDTETVRQGDWETREYPPFSPSPRPPISHVAADAESTIEGEHDQGEGRAQEQADYYSKQGPGTRDQRSGLPVEEAPLPATRSPLSVKDSTVNSPQRTDNGPIPPSSSLVTQVTVTQVEESTKERVSQEKIQELLLDIVSERTGYPHEMLDLNLNMEADLGIDSIKRVEILGSFQREFSASLGQSLEKEMESLSGVKTLQEIINWVVEASKEKEEQTAEKKVISEKKRTSDQLEEDPLPVIRSPSQQMEAPHPSPLPEGEGGPLSPLPVKDLTVNGQRSEDPLPVIRSPLPVKDSTVNGQRSEDPLPVILSPLPVKDSTVNGHRSPDNGLLTDNGLLLKTSLPDNFPSSVQRYVLGKEELSCNPGPMSLDRNRVVVITEDQGGSLARSLGDALKEQGYKVALVRMGNSVEEIGPGQYGASFGELEDVDSVLDIIRQKQGPIGSLIHLYPFRSEQGISSNPLEAPHPSPLPEGEVGPLPATRSPLSVKDLTVSGQRSTVNADDGAKVAVESMVADGIEMDLAQWRHQLRSEVKSLFYFAKLLEPDFRYRIGEAAPSTMTSPSAPATSQHESRGMGKGDSTMPVSFRSYLMAVTSMGGSFASVPQMEAPHSSPLPEGEGGPLLKGAGSFSPSQGGCAGLVKSLRHEWPEVGLKVVDLDPQDPTDLLVKEILNEMCCQSAEVEDKALSADGGPSPQPSPRGRGSSTPIMEGSALSAPVEIGYRQGKRFMLRPVPVPLQPSGTGGTQPRFQIDSSWVLLITGGARGITADVAKELARRYRPVLVLIGRSPLPEGLEKSAGGEVRGAEQNARRTTHDAPFFDLTGTLQEVKSRLIERMRRDGEEVTPGRVEARYQHLSREAEIRVNIKAIQDLGARVHYYQVDVRDETALAGLIDEIYRDLGKIDGVIHGAGIIEDKFIKDKTAESFDRVFDTKVDSAFILSRKLRFDSLKFLVFFSSVAGRFGNRGQGDYAAANEVLNKLAIYLSEEQTQRHNGTKAQRGQGDSAKQRQEDSESKRQKDSETGGQEDNAGWPEQISATARPGLQGKPERCVSTGSSGSTTRIVSINWGPWENSNMVPAGLQAEFRKRGVQLISRSEGPLYLDQEICYGRQEDAEIILGGSGWDASLKQGSGLPAEEDPLPVIRYPLSVKYSTVNGQPSPDNGLLAEDPLPVIHSPLSVKYSTVNGHRSPDNGLLAAKGPLSSSLPLFELGITFPPNEEGVVEIVRELDTARDLYLLDHRLDERPVLPMTMALELMTEVVSLGWPGWHIDHIRDLRVWQGIIVSKPAKVRIVATPLQMPVIRSPLAVKDSTVNGQRSTESGLLTGNGQRATESGPLSPSTSGIQIKVEIRNIDKVSRCHYSIVIEMTKAPYVGWTKQIPATARPGLQGKPGRFVSTGSVSTGYNGTEEPLTQALSQRGEGDKGSVSTGAAIDDDDFGHVEGKALPAPVAGERSALTWQPPALIDPRPFSLSVQEAYRQMLFHGPLLQGIGAVQEIGTNGIDGILVPSNPRQLLAGNPSGNWLIDPVIMDSGLQMIILWSRTYWDMMPLPSRFRLFRSRAPLSGSQIRFKSRILPQSVGSRGSADGILHADLAFFNEEGKLIALLEDMEAACSRSLNRLTGK